MQLNDSHHVERMTVYPNNQNKTPFTFYLASSFIKTAFGFRSGSSPPINWNMPVGSPVDTPYLKSIHAVGKIIVMICLSMTSMLAFFVHVDSPWLAENFWIKCMRARELGKNLFWTVGASESGGPWQYSFNMTTHTCPSVAHERFLVYCSWVILIMTFINLVACCASNIQTVNRIRKRDAFCNIIFGVGLMIGGILFIVSPARLAEVNTCRVTETNKTSKPMVDFKYCAEYFMSTNKYVAGSLGLICGLFYVVLACVLDNTKLFGMDAGVGQERHRTSGGTEESAPPRRSIIHTRRSSVNRVGMKKGVGSFGAVTSNMTHSSGNSKKARSGSVIDNRKS